ncbi:Uu.00g033170.m01.CDS01 [Anthostomella pinea]|uniref:Uu.00g033170.m01.CDS01 n=1 Tax=Anthostomella pinea TaxID=933095 RepID=A0AAI8V8U0_9PEZI|nr:Uu.00g033170.m01.CDS01 [Anthostomella pinea]
MLFIFANMPTPGGVNETYENILLRIDKADVDFLRRTLLWLTFAVTPLTLLELREAVAMEDDMTTYEQLEDSRLLRPEDILAIGGCLLSVSDEGYVKLAHLSVKSYLLSTDLKNHTALSRFGMDLAGAKDELAKVSLRYMCLDSLASGPASTLQDWEKRLGCHPLLHHASRSWSYYYRAASPRPQLSEQVSAFFDDRSRGSFMSWVQMLSSNWIFKWDEYPRHATPLYYAAWFGLGDVVAHLLTSGVDINAPGSRFGGTALHGATLREHPRVMEALLATAADPSQADFNHVAPLHTAARIGNPEVIRLLLDYGASKDKADSLGETPLDWAKKAGQQLSLKLIEGSDVTTPSRPPKTDGQKAVLVSAVSVPTNAMPKNAMANNAIANNAMANNAMANNAMANNAMPRNAMAENAKRRKDNWRKSTTMGRPASFG